jgi:hypothetical protein
MIVLEYNLDKENKKILKALDSMTLTKSSEEVQFSNIKVDFTGSTANELPYNYQELRIWEVGEDLDITKGELLYTGYMDGNNLPKMVNTIQDVTMEVSLLSPKAMATRRYVSANGTYYLEDLLRVVLEPLVEDGFVIKEINVGTHIKTANYFLETIETILNDLSNFYNFFWYINEKKGIYIRSIDYLMGQDAKMLIEGKVENMMSIQPTVEAYDYFNTINIKNARVYCFGYTKDGYVYGSNEYPITDTLIINQNDEVTFNNPIDLNPENLKKLCEEYGRTTLSPFIALGSSTYQITYSKETNSLTIPSTIVYDGQDTTNASIVLKKDSFYDYLITGFKWLGSKTTFSYIQSDSMLKYQKVKLYDTNEIEKCKNIISKSGIIEEVIDVNAKWFTRKELIDYAKNLITSNGNQTTDIQIIFDKDKGLDVGDLLEVNMPEFLTEGKFVITSISEQHNANDDLYTIKLKNSKFQSNYLDLFRSTSSLENDANYDISTFANYSEESINEIIEVSER